MNELCVNDEKVVENDIYYIYQNHIQYFYPNFLLHLFINFLYKISSIIWSIKHVEKIDWYKKPENW